MTSASKHGRGGSQQIAVGIYDEPELIVCGVRSMFLTSGARAAVRPLADGRASTTLDVLLCDPVDRDVDLEDYLERITTLTGAPIIAFSWSDRAHHVRRALAAGAQAFVSKTAGARELLDAVEAVHGGSPVAAPPTSSDGLSGREADVLHLVCRGLSNDEVAAALHLSVNSVKTYVRQIYRKIGAHRRTQAVAWGIARGY